MGDQETIEDLKDRLASQARLFEERLSVIEASRDADGLQEAPAGGDQPPTGFEGVGTGFATSSRVGVTINGLLQTVGDEVEIAAGSSLAVGSRATSSIKSAVAKSNGSGVEFPLWRRRFEGCSLANDCIQAFTTAIDMPVGDPSLTSRCLLDQGLSKTSARRARTAWTCLTESITDRELLSTVFDTNSPSAGRCTLCDWFLPKTLSGKSK